LKVIVDNQLSRVDNELTSLCNRLLKRNLNKKRN